MTQVRAIAGVPDISSFKGADGSPIVVDKSTGDMYYLKTGDVVVKSASANVSANAVLTSGNQTVAGIKTFLDGMEITATKYINFLGTSGLLKVAGTTVATLLEDGIEITATKAINFLGTSGLLKVGGTTVVTLRTDGIAIPAATASGDAVQRAQLNTLMTAQATTSGTTIDFTVPSWAKQITFMLNGVSTNGSSALMLQVGDAGGVEVTGYASSTSIFTGSVLSTFITTGMLLNYITGAAALQSGQATLSLMDASLNSWTYNSIVAFNGSGQTNLGAGVKSLTGALTTVRLTTANGTDTFDAGSVNVMYS